MASKRALRRKRCDRKIRHLNAEGALIACRNARKQWGERLFPYRCVSCGGFT